MPNMSTGTSQSQSTTQVVPQMLDVYNQLLSQNQQNYGNILSAYNQGGQRLTQQLGSITGGYGDVERKVMNTLGQGHPLGNGNWGVATPAAQAIGQTFAQQRGSTDQQMINAGLGNTTVRGNLQNQNALMAGQAYGGLGAQLAQTAAGYQANLGMAGLGARMQGLGMQTQLSQAMGNTLGGYHFANTAGSLTGGFSNSTGQNQASSGGGYGGAGGGSGGGGRFHDWSGSSPVPQQQYNPYAMPGGQYTDPRTIGPGGNYFGQNNYTGQWANPYEYGPNPYTVPGTEGQMSSATYSGADQYGGQDWGSFDLGSGSSALA